MTVTQTSHTLAVLGIGDLAEQVYGGLLDRPGQSAAEVTRGSGASQAAVKEALRELEDRGLVTRSASRPVRYFATAPELALGILLRQRADELDRVRAATAAYQARFAHATGSTDPLDLVEVVVGQDAVLQRVTQLQRAAQDEILVLDTPPYAASHQVTAAEVEHLERGVRARVIYDRSALEVPGQLATIGRLRELGEEARVRDGLPTKLMIADRRHAIVPLGFTRPGIDGIVLVNASPLLDALCALFESLWQAATPMAGSVDAPDDSDLLTLLAAGLKDDALARQLGVSRRTVQRRIQRLMRTVGADSRAQVVLQAARTGLLPLSTSG
ncbi:helix-turn-helix domain-containing protein [Tenggerimyces flavus]|uniref:Helix-turn-helix domain-containing protein n=1 Tax=Tenggerimyces flavus TaxID=1708749 RepID=A0ABV7YIV8_9ACTN|nr:helix-turn-helix domain-containing protein [Tenggerimyces flavus]MBM7784368.1 sugar-specific transcriptional regulator TrmB/DNA-binding CsgD family transcriptional regulator [Tenggerimyces flavus]